FSSIVAGGWGTGGGGCTSSGTDQVERSSEGGGTTGGSPGCAQPMPRTAETRTNTHQRSIAAPHGWGERSNAVTQSPKRLSRVSARVGGRYRPTLNVPV